MITVLTLTAMASTAAGRARRGLAAAIQRCLQPRLVLLRAEGQRGDVPGWVLVTVMTAGMVIALWAVAQPQLKTMFSEAMSAVKFSG